MEKRCLNCDEPVKNPVLVLPWEDGDNEYAYWECPHCKYKNTQYGYGEDQ
jgi:DNA-directed RNA polymerase subunit RPC12/RpoP